MGWTGGWATIDEAGFILLEAPLAHDHHHHHHHHHDASGSLRALTVALVLNGGFLLVEAGVGWYTGSLALLSDAAHMLSDVGALALALGAARLATRPAAGAGTFGLRRTETLGAFINGLTLLLACAWIFSEAVQRLAAGPPEIQGLPVLGVATMGLAINLGSAWWLHRVEQDNLNIRGALVHMLADALGSVGAMIAAALVMAGFPSADAFVSLFIGVLVLWATWGLLRDSARVLLQFAPPHLDVSEVQTMLASVPDVIAVHELHIWTVDGYQAVLTAHLVRASDASSDVVRLHALEALREGFGIRHATIQVEAVGDCVGDDCVLGPAEHHAH